MNDRKKTKEQLIEELVGLRQRVSESERVAIQSKRDQQVLRENEARFRSVFEGSIDSILLADPETGEIIDANPASEELFLMSREEIIGLHQSQLYPPHLREYAKVAFMRIVNEADHQVPVETVVQCSDGREKAVEILAQVVQVAGKPTVYGLFRDVTARKRDEEALRESRELLKKVFISQQDAILVLNADDPPTIMDCNPATTKVFGFAREEMLGRTTEFLHVTKEALEEFQELMLPAISDQGFFYLPEFRMRAKDGTIFDSEHTLVPISDEQNGRIGWVSVIRDITDRKRSEEAMRESQQRFRAIFDQTYEFIGLMTPEGILMEVNRAALDFAGLEESDVVGRPFWETAWWTHSPELQQRLRDAVTRSASGQFVRFEAYHQDPNGEVHDLDFSLKPVKDRQGNVILLIPEGRDITERKRAEEALRESERRYKTVVDHARDVIYTIAMDTTITSLSCAFEKATGWSRREWIGKRIEEIIHPEDWPLVVEMGIRLFSGEKPPIHEVRIRTKSSGYITAEFSIAELIENDGVVGIIGVGRDTTERKRMEEELQKAQRLKSLGVLAGGIAHDFNNILTPILANISIAKTFGNFDDGIASALADAEEACLRAKGLTQQMLAFSKGGMPVKKLAQVSRLLMDETRFASSGSNVRWEYSIPKDLWWVEMDQGQIGQVIRNLIINADQAMPAGGTARIEAANTAVGPNDPLPLKEGKYVRIVISDKGVGIPQTHLPRIFDPFYSTKDKGSGLGLSISHTIIKRHHGTIQVESEVGTGTSFHIYLPASEKERAVEGKEWTKALRGEGRILLIDDDKAVRRSAQEMLRRLGYDVESAKDGEEGLRLYRRAQELGRPFPTVIMDLTIPGGMGGRDAIKKMKEANPDAKIIVSSGYSDDPVMAGPREYGFRAALSKPYDIQQLAELVHKVVMEGHD